MKTVSVHEAKTYLSTLLDRAHAGEEVIIAKRGTPYARLCPLEPPPARRPGLLAGTVLGAGLGMLFAPRAGSEIRNQLSEQAGRLRSTAGDTYHQASDKVSHLVDRGREAYERARGASSQAGTGTPGVGTSTPGVGTSTGATSTDRASYSTPGSANRV